MRRTVAIACDHAGVEAKMVIKQMLQEQDYVIIDCEFPDSQPLDYPDVAVSLCTAALRESAPGIILCGSGIGVSIAANKIGGIRAALCHNEFTARLARQHNDANVLALGARVLGIELMLEIVAVFLHTDYSGEERHGRRIAKLAALDDDRHASHT
jgi:RpiB/LacA/LacB family sugar-phosphate isomerase